MKNCESCVYKTVDVETGINNCSRYPPNIAAVNGINSLQQPTVGAMVLPIQVADDYWCGEYKEKLKALHTA